MTKTRVYLDQDKTKTMRVWDQVETKNKVEQDWVKTRRYTTFPNVFGWSAPWQNLHTAVINEIQSALRPIPRKKYSWFQEKTIKKMVLRTILTTTTLPVSKVEPLPTQNLLNSELQYISWSANVEAKLDRNELEGFGCVRDSNYTVP